MTSRGALNQFHLLVLVLFRESGLFFHYLALPLLTVITWKNKLIKIDVIVCLFRHVDADICRGFASLYQTHQWNILNSECKAWKKIIVRPPKVSGLTSAVPKHTWRVYSRAGAMCAISRVSVSRQHPFSTCTV